MPRVDLDMFNVVLLSLEPPKVGTLKMGRLDRGLSLESKYDADPSLCVHSPPGMAAVYFCI